jgi:tetratricopeptide (TPR) repeat protein
MAIRIVELSQITLKFIFVIGIVLLAHNVQASTIMGIVYDNQRNPLSDVDVELLDDFYRSVNRARTDGNGRYEFGGLKDGRYSVRVLAFRYDFIDETASVEIATITSGVAGQVGNAIIPQDFYLQPKKGSLLEAELAVVFAQAVPKEAEKIYGNALKNLSQKKTDEGIVQLRESIKLFPNYYLALHRLGRELFFKGEYGEAAQMSLKATEVNPKSGTSFYYLGNSLSKLNYNKAAIVALNQALVIAPSSVQVLYVLGKAENLEGKYTDAEKHFLEAKKLSKTAIPDIHWELAQLYGNSFKKYTEAADELELYLKAGKFDGEHTKRIKKIIINLREKAKTQLSKT